MICEFNENKDIFFKFKSKEKFFNVMIEWIECYICFSDELSFSDPNHKWDYLLVKSIIR